MEGPTFSQTHDSTSKQNEIMYEDYLNLFSVYFIIVTNNTFIIFRYLKKLVKLFTVQSIMFVIVAKGQLISKANFQAVDSPKKRTNEFGVFAFLLFTAKKSNSSIRFLGESTAHQSAFRN